jgi:hypothetical protein
MDKQNNREDGKRTESLVDLQLTGEQAVQTKAGSPNSARSCMFV